MACPSYRDSTVTPKNPKNDPTDENKGNNEQKQNEHRDRPLNSYEALMAKITELKSFVMEELYTINKHFIDLSSRIDSGKCHKEIVTLREDCASKNCIIKILVEDLSKYTNSFYKVNQKSNNRSYTDVNSQND